MELILLEKIRNLGQLGDQVKVKAGYARNYLLPHGKAVIANAANRATFQARRAELEKTIATALTAAQARALPMEGATVQILAKAGEEGRLFGSVGAADIAGSMTQAGFPLERSEIHLPDGPLKTVGDHTITVTLHPEVNATIHVSVVAEA